jgi:branched-subunit amino acid aminotransferase/4-amino-4-deoxychorismate lyase
MPHAVPPDSLSLLETMRLENGVIVRRQGHLTRMAAAARALGFAWSDARVAAALTGAAASTPEGRWRIRLLVDRDGTPTVERLPFPVISDRPWKVALALEPVEDADPFLRIKTTYRHVYDRLRAASPGCDDVILWSSRGEITESTIANVVVELQGALYTPPSSAPLLAGVFRGELLKSGRIHERPITKEEARSAARVWLINSLREWIAAEW